MLLDRIAVTADVHALRPDFAVCAIAITGAGNGAGDAVSEAWLRDAEAFAAPPADLPAHVTAWQEAFRAFGAKPQRTASSVEALWKRARGGVLPRVNWLVDLYNARSDPGTRQSCARIVKQYGGPELEAKLKK